MHYPVLRFLWLSLIVSACATSPASTPSAIAHEEVAQEAVQTEVQKYLIEDLAEVQPDTVPKIYTVAIISDLNSSYGSKEYTPQVHAAVQWLAELKPELVISTGDMVAGMKPGLDYPGMWKAFHEAVTTPLADASIPLLPTPGNHDGASSPKFQEERREYERQWSHRKPELDWVDDANWPTQYAFRLGKRLFVGLDLSTPRHLSSTDLAWLDQLLRNDPGAIVFGHVPIAPVAHGRVREASYDMKLLEVLRRHEAVFIHGHHHAYYRYTLDGVLSISAPCLGTGPRRLQGVAERSPQGLIVLKIHEDRLEDMMLTVPGFEEIAASTLPERLVWGETTLSRADQEICDTSGVC